MKKQNLPSVSNLNLSIDLPKLQAACDEISYQFTDVMTANPQLCENHAELVKHVYDNFSQINLTTSNETLPFTSSVKERLQRREEHLYNIPTPAYTGSYFQEIISQLQSPASRVRITRLAPGKTIPFHVDYDVSYAVRCICPIYSDDNVVNLFKRNGGLEAYTLLPGNVYFLNIGYPHAVVNMSDRPRIALMFSLDGTKDLEHL
jgi:hypothetical protein